MQCSIIKSVLRLCSVHKQKQTYDEPRLSSSWLIIYVSRIFFLFSFSELMSPCPDVSSGCPDLTCDNSVQSYLKVDDRHCPACTVCISGRH